MNVGKSIEGLTLPITGGCRCGAVRYASASKPLLMFLCHCNDCQAFSGGPFAAVVLLKASSFTFTRGKPTYYSTPRLEGGLHRRGFCGTCGSRLTGGESEDGTSPFVGVTAGSLDDASWFKPEANIFASHAQPWEVVDRTITTHELSFPKRD
jgi:hypothetical protein